MSRGSYDSTGFSSDSVSHRRTSTASTLSEGSSSKSSPIAIPSPVPSSPSYSHFGSAYSISSSSSGSYGPLSHTTSSEAVPSLATRQHGAPAARQQRVQSPPSTPADWQSSLFNPSPSRRSPRSQQSRRFSGSFSTGESTPFGSFVGSYENSLLSGRLSALPSLPMPFVASIGVLGSAETPTKLRCPPHLSIPFGAFFYSGPEGAQSSSPYVGTIDLENHFLSLAAAHPSSSPSSLPRFPGYRIPEKGQLQLVIKNANATAIKLFLIPYDLTGLSRSGMGGKTFLRQKSYAIDDSVSLSSSQREGGKKSLRYAVHLQFCSPPTSSSTQKPTFYVHQTVRVVFASSRAFDFSEKLQVVNEAPGGREGENGKEEERVSPYRGPSEEWDMARRKAKARERVAFAAAAPSSGLERQAVIEPAKEEEPLCLRPLGPLLNTPPSSSPPRREFSLLSVSNAAPTRLSGISSSRPPSPSALVDAGLCIQGGR